MAQDGFGTMAEDYVKILWNAEEWAGDSPTTNEIAARLGVAAPTVSGNLRRLAREGLIDYEPYGRATLTDAGRTLGADVVRRHRLLETFLVEHLGYGWDEVHDEAEVLEHAVSDRLLAVIDQELGYPDHDPHGDPIPRPGSTHPEGRRLRDVEPGRTVVVARVSDHEPELLRYLAGLTIGVGTRITVEARHDFAGSMTIVIGGSERAPASAPTPTTRTELAFPAANAMWVRDGTEP
ncbi:metal-dependent transcriptional regulator [Frondihabitans australicus]|uniref:metal-dependent transcriptional regulator n=1 Tax=Frondihabitans australicus TaxID=386892 RepID=UPI000EB414EC|nr:metal-dependent transcriptional regulator [Frondihabitans australicus]